MVPNFHHQHELTVKIYFSTTEKKICLTVAFAMSTLIAYFKYSGCGQLQYWFSNLTRPPKPLHGSVLSPILLSLGFLPHGLKMAAAASYIILICQHVT